MWGQPPRLSAERSSALHKSIESRGENVRLKWINRGLVSDWDGGENLASYRSPGQPRAAVSTWPVEVPLKTSRVTG